MSLRNQPKSLWCHAFFTVWVELLWNVAIVHVAICSLFGGSVVPLLIHSLLGSPPSCVASSLIIHDSHRFLSSSFSGLAALSSTGWHRLVHPPGICGTQLIDLCYNQNHHVAPVRIQKQKRNNMRRHLQNIVLQHLLHPLQHNYLP